MFVFNHACKRLNVFFSLLCLIFHLTMFFAFCHNYFILCSLGIVVIVLTF